MSSNDPNPFQAARGVFNNQLYRQSIIQNFCTTQTDCFRATSADQVGVYFLHGASSTNALETNSQGNPVRTNTSTPSGAGQTLLALGPEEAIWSNPTAPIDASYVLWPPGNTAPDLTLPNRRVLAGQSAGSYENVEVITNGDVRLQLGDSPVAPGTYGTPEINVDQKGRIINIQDNQTIYTPWTPAVNGIGNLDSIGSANCFYSRFFDKVTLLVDITFTSEDLGPAPVAPPPFFVFEGLPAPAQPAVGELKMTSCIGFENGTFNIRNRGELYVSQADYADSIVYAPGNGNDISGIATVRVVGSLFYTGI